MPIKILYEYLLPKEWIIKECIEEFGLSSKFCIVINLTDNPIIFLPRNFVLMASLFSSDIEFDTYYDS